MSTLHEDAQAISIEAGPILGEFSNGRMAVDFAKLCRLQGQQVTVTPGINQHFAVRQLVSLSQIRPLRVV